MTHPTSEASPPGLARRLLRALLPGEDRRTFPAELDDVYRRRLRSMGALRARWWYRGQVASLALRLARHRLRAVDPRGRPGASPASGRNVMEAVIRDLRHAARGLRRRLGFTVVAVVSLAVGIGANTAVFSLVNAVLLASPAVEEPERLMEIYTADSDGNRYATSSYPDVRDLRAASDEVFEGVVSWELLVATTERGGSPEVLMGELVSAGYFEVLGVDPWMGRTFVAASDEPDVVVVSHAYWQEEMGADPAALGRTLRLNRRPFTVIGIAPEEFRGMTPALVPDFWVPSAVADLLKPAGTNRLESRSTRSLFVKARLRDGVAPDRAAEWVEAFSRRLAGTYPGSNEGRVMTALPAEGVALHPAVDRALVPVAGLLLSVVLIVLLITCANLASFLLARAEERRREVAVRVALGAGRSSLVRRFLTETVLLAGLGGALGLLLAKAGVGALMRFTPPLPLPVNLHVGLDGRVLLFTFGATLLAGLAFGIAPALRATRGDPAPALREGRKAGAGGRSGSRLRRGLVVAQVALSLVLLVGAGLFVRSLREARSVEPGFDTGPAAILWADLQLSGVPDSEGPVLWRELERRLLADPLIDAVALADVLPLGAGIQSTRLEIPGFESDRPDGRWSVDMATVSPSYFPVLDIPVLRGRGFTASDRDTTSTAVLVSRAFEDRFFPEGAVGRTVRGRGSELSIVGVVGDTKVRTLSESPRPRIYYPHGWTYISSTQLVVRGGAEPARLLERSREVLDEVRPGIVLLEAKTMQEHLALMLFPPRMAALLLTALGGLALLLATIGLYGVVSYAVARRTREMGIRLSLGASPGDVVALVVRGGIGMVLLGGVIGLGLSLLAGSAISAFLVGVSGHDVVTFVAIPLLLLGVGAVASLVPALRATRVAPAEVLRDE